MEKGETSDSRHIAVRVDACTLHVAVSDHCCTCTNLGFTAYSICHDFILFDAYIQWKKKEEKRCDGNATRSRCALHTRATHARLACARTYTLTHAHTGSITSLMIYPTESSLLLRCNGERRRFARECWREKKQRRGRHKLALAQWRERQKRRRTEDEKERARDRRKHCQGALKSRKRKTRKRERERDGSRSIYHTLRWLLIIHTRFPARHSESRQPLSMPSFSLVARTCCSREMARPVGSDWVKCSFNEYPTGCIVFVFNLTTCYALYL